MAINKQWHLAHHMPKSATLEQRIRWHKEHAENCACRPVPEALRQKIEKLNNERS
jgi:hypothetical protein